MPNDRLSRRGRHGAKRQRARSPILNFRTAFAVCTFVAVVSLGVYLTARAVRALCSGGSYGAIRTDTPSSRAEALLGRLTAGMGPVLTESRQVLLGYRPAGDPTCITQRLEDNRILLQGSPKGGAGLRLMAFYAGSPDPPLALYSWSQEQLRPFLLAQRKANASALARAEELAAVARVLAAEIGPRPNLSGLTIPRAQVTSPAWPAECLRRLTAALAAGDASAAPTWAEELAAATFGLADLHRWLDVLLGNHLAALDFQARCRAAFLWADSAGAGPAALRPFGPGAADESSLPAAGLTVAWGQNFLEVEHQAEGLFQPGADAVAAVTSGPWSDTPSARWMPPEVRHAFRWLRAYLSPAAQEVWDRAAAAPFERSYLANMLFRAQSARSLESLALVLERFGQFHPSPTQAELMDVLFYRSGFYSSGYHWADRYDTRLLQAAGEIAGDPQAVAERARGWTHNLLKGWENYVGNVMTLTEALDNGKLDCLRGTDMIGALYRDAGHGEYFVVRLRCGTIGHSVGAVPVEHHGGRQLLLLDALSPSPACAVWPSAYFQDLTWPPGYPGPQGPLFAAELYVRGLDGYLFAEGYVVRGESAGRLLRAALPYLPDRRDPSVTTVFDGPYPAIPSQTPPPAPAQLPPPGATP